MNVNELKLSEQGRIKFIAEVKKEMSLRGWRAKDLAERIGYTKESVYLFFSNSRIQNKRMAGAICTLFGFNATEYTN